MMQNLAEQYRPTSFEDFKGSELVASMLKKMVETSTLPNCMMFTGPKGVGKTSMCRIIDKALNGEGHSSLAYIEVDAASNSGVDNIRSLQETVRFSHSGEWRLVVLDEAHSLSQAAFNALLKVLEDPPQRTVFILVTTKPESIPDTVRSRAMAFRFNPLPVPVIARRLVDVVQAENLPIRDPKILIRISEVADGSMRTAMVLLQQLQHVPDPSVDTVNQLAGYTVNTKDLLYAMLGGSLLDVEVELSGVFSGTCNIEKFLEAFVETLKEFHKSNLISNAQFLACMEVVWNMRKLQRGNDAVLRTQFEAGLFAMFAQNFWNGEESAEVKDLKTVTASDILKHSA